MAIQATTFDFWNTLFSESPGSARDVQVSVTLQFLQDAGYYVDQESIEKAYDAAWAIFLASWRANRQYTYLDGARECLESLIGRAPSADLFLQLATRWVDAAEHIEVTPVEDVFEVLGTLRAAGLRLGVICDVGFVPSTMLREYLKKHGMLTQFIHFSFSDEVGCYKPDPLIFRNALRGLEVRTPSRAAHVGDGRRTDIAGAKAVGMHAIRFAGIYDDTEETEGPSGDVVIHSLAELPTALGL